MSVVQKGDTIFVWFSCGAASAVALKKTVEKYSGLAEIRAYNNPIKEEHSDNQRFLKDIESWVGLEVKPAINPAYPSASARDVWKDRKGMSFPNGAPCTMLLKREVRLACEMLSTYNGKLWTVLGFTAEEKHRHDRRVENGDDNLLPILIREGITKDDCYQIILDAGIKLPEIYSIGSRFGSGFPNANCIGCVKATSPTYWNHVPETFPEVFADRAKMSREYNCKLVRYKGKRIFLDELPPNATGRSMKTMNVECGVVCLGEDK